MNLEALFQQAFNLAGTFSPTLVVFLFIICFIGEFGICIPYLLETIWLLSGYNFGTGVIPLIDLLLLWLVAQVGRQAGGFTLSYLGRFGSMPIIKFYNKHFEASVSEKLAEDNSTTVNFFRRINFLSPFSVALGRLVWLRIPITLILGAKRQLKTLSLGVLLSSLVWDGIYISLGIVVGANVVLEPFQMILYSLAGLTLLYVTNFAVRRLLRLRIFKNGVK
jgi:membrane protein DedA with SNARE-associated domain